MGERDSFRSEPRVAKQLMGQSSAVILIVEDLIVRTTRAHRPRDRGGSGWGRRRAPASLSTRPRRRGGWLRWRRRGCLRIRYRLLHRLAHQRNTGHTDVSDVDLNLVDRFVDHLTALGGDDFNFELLAGSHCLDLDVAHVDDVFEFLPAERIRRVSMIQIVAEVSLAAYIHVSLVRTGQQRAQYFNVIYGIGVQQDIAALPVEALRCARMLILPAAPRGRGPLPRAMAAHSELRSRGRLGFDGRFSSRAR